METNTVSTNQQISIETDSDIVRECAEYLSGQLEVAKLSADPDEKKIHSLETMLDQLKKQDWTEPKAGKTSVNKAIYVLGLIQESKATKETNSYV